MRFKLRGCTHVGMPLDALVRLQRAGKAKKVVLTACTRKLLTILNAMLKHRTPWRQLEAHRA